MAAFDSDAFDTSAFDVDAFDFGVTTDDPNTIEPTRASTSYIRLGVTFITNGFRTIVRKY